MREALNMEDEDPLEGQYVPHYTAFADKEEYSDLVARVKGGAQAVATTHRATEQPEQPGPAPGGPGGGMGAVRASRSAAA